MLLRLLLNWRFIIQICPPPCQLIPKTSSLSDTIGGVTPIWRNDASTTAITRVCGLNLVEASVPGFRVCVCVPFSASGSKLTWENSAWQLKKKKKLPILFLSHPVLCLTWTCNHLVTNSLSHVLRRLDYSGGEKKITLDFFSFNIKYIRVLLHLLLLTRAV